MAVRTTEAPRRRSYPVLKWITRVLALDGAIFSAFLINTLVNQLRRLNPPFVLPGAPLGTFEQPTQLSLFIFLAANVLFFAGSVLALFRPAIAARLLFTSAAVETLLLAGHRLLTPSLPNSNYVAGLAFGVLPPMLIGALLLVSQRKTRMKHLASQVSAREPAR